MVTNQAFFWGVLVIVNAIFMATGSVWSVIPFIFAGGMLIFHTIRSNA